MSPCPEGVEVVVRWLRQIVVVLSHLERENKTQSREKQDGPYRRNRGHEADVVPLLHSVAGRSFVVGERVAVVTWECGIVSHIWVLQLFSLGNLCWRHEPVLWDSFSESMKESLFSARTLSPNLRRPVLLGLFNMTICATYIPKVWLVPGCIVEAEISCAGRDCGPQEPLVGRRPLHRASWLSAFSPMITIELAISDGLLAWLLNWLQLIFER